MPDLAGPFDGSTFAQAQWYRDAGPSTPSGVIGPPSNTAAGGELGLTAAGFGLTLGLGRARVRGAAYERTGSAWTDTVPANTSSAGPRNDLIVLRRSLTAKTVVPTRLQGTAAATPADPPLTQVEDGVWDLPLFRVQAPASSGTPLIVTDLRPWIDPNSGELVPFSAAFTAAGAGQPSNTRWGPGAMTAVTRRGDFTTPSADRIKLPTDPAAAGLYLVHWRFALASGVFTGLGNMTLWCAASPTVVMASADAHVPAGPTNDVVTSMSALVNAAAGDQILFQSMFPLSATVATTSVIRLTRVGPPL